MSSSVGCIHFSNSWRFHRAKARRFHVATGTAFPRQFPARIILHMSPCFFYSAFCGARDRRVRASGRDGGGYLDGELVEAREAVAEVLMEAGLPEAESARVALSSPRYVKMLMESVRELDEASLWKSWGMETEDEGSLSLKAKVACMAREKGDGGFIPFLESVGLSPSSLMHIARYLSSEKLPDIVAKVNYVKKLLFSGSEEVNLIGKKARRMMMHLSIFVDDEIQQTLSFYEKMEARRGGLNMLDSGDASFPCLIESFPRLLQRSAESHYNSLVEFFETVGVPISSIRILFLLFPPILFCDIDDDIKPRLQALKKVGVDGTDAGRLLVKYPWLLSTSVQGNFETIYSFFDREKVPKVNVDRAIRSWPHLLGCSTNKLRTMVEHFADFDVRSKKLGRVMASRPQLLLRKPHELLEVVSFLRELDFDEDSIGRLLIRCPEIFAASVENTLKKKIQFLTEFGIGKNQLHRIIRKYPELLVSDLQNTILPRMIYLTKMGFSRREVVSMVSRFSPLLGYSINEVLKPKLEFLVHTMNKPVNDIVEYPRYFSYSLDKKIKPRYWVLKGRSVECTLKEMLGKNDEEFAAEYMGVGRILIPPVLLNDR